MIIWKNNFFMTYYQSHWGEEIARRISIDKNTGGSKYCYNQDHNFGE